MKKRIAFVILPAISACSQFSRGFLFQFLLHTWSTLKYAESGTDKKGHGFLCNFSVRGGESLYIS